MRLAFFIDGDEIAQKISDLNWKLEKDVFYQVLIVVLIITLLIIILGVMRVRVLAKKMTL